MEGHGPEGRRVLVAPGSVDVRARAVSDADAVLRLVRAAFSRAGRDGEYEVRVVERTWSSVPSATSVDLVAVDERDRVVGHLLAAPGVVDEKVPLLAIAPLAVAPGRQRRGVGSALVRFALQVAGSREWPAVVLRGSPDYYGRFGFVPAHTVGLRYPPAGDHSPDFQVYRFTDAVPSGRFRYCWEPDPLRTER